MKIAVEGCSHGELDNIYESLRLLEENENIQIDLLICCGDFQASRNESDLLCMAVPEKYCSLCSFYKYYNGEKIAPILTIFIGGNHEASNYLQELPYGGWVAPNIFYLGYAGVINIAGVRIAGLSGIYKALDYRKGHFEIAPYNENTKRSVYHVRNLEVFRLKQLTQPIDIFLSHDWPMGITNYGNRTQLVKFKPFFKDDIESGKLGSPPSEELLNLLKPTYWFAAHMHCKFAALVPHAGGKRTKFLSLDKCLPKRRFLQILDIDHDPNLKVKISYDLEWLSILRATNHLLSIKNSTQYMPGPNGNERWCFSPTKEEEDFVLKRFEYNLVVPQNFTVAQQNKTTLNRKKKTQPSAKLNLQTIEFCEKLSIDDPIQLLLLKSTATSNETEQDRNIICNMTKSFIEDSQVFEENESEDELEIEGDLLSNQEKLKLPEPKYTDEDDSATGELSEENFVVNNLSLEEVCKSRDDKCDDVPDKDLKDGCESNSQDMPMNKKIKRRNAEIYSVED